jgi:hypothetical protein
MKRNALIAALAVACVAVVAFASFMIGKYVSSSPEEGQQVAVESLVPSPSVQPDITPSVTPQPAQASPAPAPAQKASPKPSASPAIDTRPSFSMENFSATVTGGKQAYAVGDKADLYIELIEKKDGTPATDQEGFALTLNVGPCAGDWCNDVVKGSYDAQRGAWKFAYAPNKDGKMSGLMSENFVDVACTRDAVCYRDYAQNYYGGRMSLDGLRIEAILIGNEQEAIRMTEPAEGATIEVRKEYVVKLSGAYSGKVTIDGGKADSDMTMFHVDGDMVAGSMTFKVPYIDSKYLPMTLRLGVYKISSNPADRGLQALTYGSYVHLVAPGASH